MSGSLAVLAVAYLLGSIPFGYLAGWTVGIDLRRHGSGNTGGTNAVRVLGPKRGVPVILLDVAKGALAVLVARHYGGVGLEVLAAIAAMVGHMFPVFLGFGGGKGVAVGAGATLALVPVIGALSVPIWIGVSLLTGYVSVGSIVTALAITLMAFLFDEPWQVKAFCIAATAIVLWRHRGNIGRLRSRSEHRVNIRGWWAARRSTI
ncbi:MAG TPA: glycerol-3-phosphate 1-O-acyltransferase PlsY [Gaiellales bacterium]|nr:glycerol-3-phosphate 1-O-acyltransferase PlsY [Gaiellales bacterium]